MSYRPLAVVWGNPCEGLNRTVWPTLNLCGIGLRSLAIENYRTFSQGFRIWASLKNHKSAFVFNIEDRESPWAMSAHALTIASVLVSKRSALFSRRSPCWYKSMKDIAAPHWSAPTQASRPVILFYEHASRQNGNAIPIARRASAPSRF
jgi:hypothetical protein